jgi:signal transduction histidine kinase
MRARRLARGLVVPTALLALVGTLATLQYRWLGQVSDAEREQLRESLERRAREFAEEFDHEITRVYQVLQPGEVFDPASPEVFAARYDQWLAGARAPRMVKAAYFVKAAEAGFDLYQYDAQTRAFARTDWPASLAPVQRHLTGTTEAGRMTPAGSPGAKVVAIASTQILPEVPAILIAIPVSTSLTLPRLAPGAMLDHELLMAIRMSHHYIVAELDAAFLATEMLPALITRHFTESGSTRYRVSVVDAGGEPVASRNVASGDVIDAARADVATPFFVVRPEIVRSATLTWTAPVAPRTGSAGAVETRALSAVRGEFAVVAPLTPGQRTGSAGTMAGPIAIRTAAGHWRLLVQHDAGSVDAAVEAARQRNLWLSYGILAVLVAGVGLIVINARRSERLAAQRMDFVATVSHELRTPIAVMRSAAQNLSAGVVHEAAQARRYGELIEDEGRRLTEMVEQVLEYAGLEGNLRPKLARAIDAGALAADVVASCRPLFQAEDVEVTTTVAADVPPVAADEGGLRRALNNLLMNALKYASAGRVVSVEVQPGRFRGRTEVQIAVSDRGPGIAADDLGHIFEPFYRGQNATERQIHGNGLGLSLVKRIAEAHGGRVTVRSSPGAGATFTLHLPAAEGHAPAQPLEPAPHAGGATP